jgi:hypothetical protein
MPAQPHLRGCRFGYFKTAAESLIDLALRVLALLRSQIPHGHLKALVAQPMLYGPWINAAPECPRCESISASFTLEFRLQQFKMLVDAVEDYVAEKYPATGGH